MSTNLKYDLVVIGGGPAGYAAAIRAGQLGKKVACVEQERPGGTCLNWGCIPSKALIKSAELFNKIKHCEEFGISVTGASYDFTKIIQRSRNVSGTMAKGIEFLFKKNKVDYIKGVGTIAVPGMVEITDGPDKGKILVTENTLIATGCKPRQLPDLEVDGVRVMTSRQALEMKTQPKSVVIVGAGAIGAEFAYFLNAFGTKVTLVEMLDQVLPVEDHEVAAVVAKEFNKQGIDCRTSTAVENIKVAKNNVKMDLVKGWRGRVDHCGLRADRHRSGCQHRRTTVCAHQARARSRLHQSRWQLRIQRQGDLRGRRHHWATLARACGDLRSDSSGAGHVWSQPSEASD